MAIITHPQFGQQDAPTLELITEDCIISVHCSQCGAYLGEADITNLNLGPGAFHIAITGLCCLFAPAPAPKLQLDWPGEAEQS